MVDERISQHESQTCVRARVGIGPRPDVPYLIRGLILEYIRGARTRYDSTVLLGLALAAALGVYLYRLQRGKGSPGPPGPPYK